MNNDFLKRIFLHLIINRYDTLPIIIPMYERVLGSTLRVRFIDIFDRVILFISIFNWFYV